MTSSSRRRADPSRRSSPKRAKKASASVSATRPPSWARPMELIISCGGGVIKNEANMDALRQQNGVVFFIDRDLSQLISTDS